MFTTLRRMILFGFLFLLVASLNVHTSYAATIDVSPNCNPTGTPYTLLGTLTVTPPSVYEYNAAVTNETTGQTYAESGINNFVGAMPFFSASIVVSPGDVIRFELKLDDGTSITIYPCGGGSSGNPMLLDGRINGQQGAPVVLYCDETTINGFDVNGAPLFSIENGETADGAGWSMGVTADGRIVLTSAFPDGKAYYFVFDGCPSGQYDALSGDPAIVFDSGSY